MSAFFILSVQLVAPKRKRLAEAESLLAQQMSHLNEKRGELKEVMDKLQNLNDDYRSKVNKKRVRVIKPSFLVKVSMQDEKNGEINEQEYINL